MSLLFILSPWLALIPSTLSCGRGTWPAAKLPLTYIGHPYQATVTGYGAGGCNSAAHIGKCGFLGSGTFPHAAMSAGFNEPPQPGQCGTCWELSQPRTLCYNTKPPHICPSPDNVDDRSQDGLIVLVTNTCAPYYDPSNLLGACNQKDGSKDALGSSTVVDLCMDTDAAKAWWNSTRAGLNVATVQQVDCKSWPGTMGPQASWLGNGYKGCPGCLPPAPKSKSPRPQVQAEAAPYLASGKDAVDAEQHETGVEMTMVD